MELVTKIKSRIEATRTRNLNGYARTYIKALEVAYNEYGIKGIIAQLNYIIANVKDKPLRKELESIVKQLKDSGELA